MLLLPLLWVKLKLNGLRRAIKQSFEGQGQYQELTMNE